MVTNCNCTQLLDTRTVVWKAKKEGNEDWAEGHFVVSCMMIFSFFYFFPTSSYLLWLIFSWKAQICSPCVLMSIRFQIHLLTKLLFNTCMKCHKFLTYSWNIECWSNHQINSLILLFLTRFKKVISTCLVFFFFSFYSEECRLILLVTFKLREKKEMGVIISSGKWKNPMEFTWKEEHFHLIWPFENSQWMTFALCGQLI